MADPKYGASGAGFADTIARLRAESAAIDELNAKESQRAAVEERSTTATEGNASARTATAKAASTLIDTVGRSIEVMNSETQSILRNTEAWAANAAARGRTIGAAGAAGVGTLPGAGAGATREPPAVFGPGGRKAPRDTPRAPSGGATDDLSAVADRNSAALATQAERQAVVNDLANQSAAAYAASSQALQRHGALTSEFFQGLARGEVTLKEFESQMLITLGKFSGWAVAGGLVYGAFEAVKDIAGGIEATQSGVSQLKRSLGEKVNVPEAEAGFRRVSQETNTPIAKVAEAQFYAARAFPNQKESLDVAGTAVRAEKLDEVPVQEAIKSFGALNVEFGLGATGIKEVFNELDAGQLKFNARINQTLPQVGRAAASFANAGGTPTQLVQQIIELNRATGGGGGQGGGNPATFLIREPGNLAKPATEDVLRQYGFDPKKAQQHIGDFNEEVQKQAASGRLNKNDLKEIATAVGGGTANGLRYGLPLFAAGTSGLAANVRRQINPQAAAGSAEEDLKHKLEQLNEQGHKAGITLENVGSDLASIGVGPALSDAAHGLNAVLSAVELLTGGLAFLLKPLTELPAPIRVAGEAFLAYKGAQLASRSGPGLAARGLAGDAGLTFLGGGSKELTAVQATQRSYVQFLQSEQEKLSNTALTAGSRAKLAGAQVTAFAQPEGQAPAIGTEERTAYDQQLAALTKKEVTTAEAQQAARDAQLEQQKILLAAEEQLAALTNKRVAVQERLAAASESGLYAAQLGAPNTLPILAPNAAAAERQGVSGVAAVPGAGGVEAGSAAVEAEAVAAAGLVGGTGSKLVGAESAVKGLATDLVGVAGRLKGFISGLGPLGIAVAGFVGLNLLAKATGGNSDFEKGADAISALEGEVTSEKDALEKIQKARGVGKHVNDLGPTVHDVLAHVEHPIAGIESIFEPGSHPEDFASDQAIVAERSANALAKKVKSGSLKSLGKAAALPEEALKEYAAKIEEEFTKVGEGGAGGEKAATALERNLKLQFDKLKLFGSSGSGQQTLQQLETAYGAELSKATTGGSEAGLDEFAKVSEEETKRIAESVDHEVKQAERTAQSSQQRAAILASARSKLGESYKRGATEPLAKAETELAETQKNLTTVNSALTGKPGGTIEIALKKRKQALEGEKSKQQAGIPLIKRANQSLKETIEEQEESLGKEAFSQDQAQNKSGSAIGEASPNKLKSAKAALEEARKNTQAAESKLKGNERKNVLPELEAAEEKAEQAVAAAALSLIKSKGSKKEALVGNQQPVQLAQVQLKEAEEQARYIESHKKDFSLEEVIDAQTAVIKAKKAVNEAINQNAQQISQLNTQISQANSEGNAQAQADEAIQGANSQIRLAVGSQQRLQGQLALINANNQLQKAFQEKVKSEGELAKSLTTSPTKEAKIDVSTDTKLLALAVGPDEKRQAQTDLNNAKKSQTAALVSNREREIAFQEEMGNISKQQAILQYTELLKVHNISQQAREELRSKIRGLQKGAANNQVFDLAPGSIKLPTAYDVHRAAAQAASRGLAASGSGLPTVSSIINQPTTITINVADSSDVHKVGEEVDRVMGSSIHTRLRKAGLRGN